MPDSLADRARDAVASRAELPGMTLLEHLEELRRRIMWSAVSLVPAFLVVWHFHEQVFEFMQRPIIHVLHKNDPTAKLVVTSPTDAFNLYLKISLVGGLFLASPFILYQAWLFISPGLYRKEKGYVVPFMVATVSLFLSGGYFGYRIVFPYAMDFLISFGSQFQQMITVGEYTNLLMTVILGLGLIFEEPIIIFFLALMGMVSPGFLWRNVRYAILISFIIAAVITPTPDIMSMCIIAAPMIVLYGLSIGVAALAYPSQRKSTEENQP